jgi:hypothetical protein
MSIADQLTQAKADLDAVYEAGKAENFKYATQFKELFYSAAFPKDYELSLDLPNASENMNGMFRLSTGLKKLTFSVPKKNADDTPIAYNLGYFVFSTANKSSLEEIIFINGIKVSAFNYFAQYCSSLIEIKGELDLSEVTNTQNCFLRCNALHEVRFAANSIKVNISFANCENLSNGSITSIINGLSTEASGQTLTVHPTVAAKITETDVTDRGWTLAY